jgi:uncharacterized protein DUF4386
VKRVSPAIVARIAGVFYLLTFVSGIVALVVRGSVGVSGGLVAAACYVVVTLLFYVLFKPVSHALSLLAAAISLAGIVVGPLRLTPVNPLVFFGCYCLLVGYLVFTSTYLPRFLGVLMAIAGLGWLTFLSPPLARALSPFVYGPGLLGEGALTLWLLAKGVDVANWQQRANAADSSMGRAVASR